MEQNELAAVNRAINYRTISDYACTLANPQEASVISGMMCRLALRNGVCVRELNDSIFRIDRASCRPERQGYDTGADKTPCPTPAASPDEEACPPPAAEAYSPAEAAMFADATSRVLRHHDSGFVTSRIRAMGMLCHEDWHYACMMAVCDDHGLLVCRTQLTEFVRMLIALGLVNCPDDDAVRRMARNIGRIVRRLPLCYREWGDGLKLFRSKCISLADCLDETTPYRRTGSHMNSGAAAGSRGF